VPSSVDFSSATHDLTVSDFGAKSKQVNGKGASTSIVFRADKKGDFTYICSLPGHVAAGMIGEIVVGDAALQVKALGADMPLRLAPPSCMPRACSPRTSRMISSMAWLRARPAGSW
jgi:hypothetical protein